jgi:hypothetical protein
MKRELNSKVKVMLPVFSQSCIRVYYCQNGIMGLEQLQSKVSIHEITNYRQFSV